MNKIKILSVVLAAILLFAACNKDNSSNNSSDNDSTAAVVNDEFVGKAYKMVYKFPEGLSLKYKLTSVDNTSQTITQPDSSVTSDVTQTSTYVFHIKSLGKTAENYKLSITINSVNLRATYKDEVVEFDSEKDIDDASKKKFAEYAALNDATYNIVVDERGMIQEVTDIDKVVDNFLKIQNAPSITADQRTQLETQMKQAAIQPISQQMFKYMPENEVGIDSTWEFSYDSGMSVFQLKNTAKSSVININEKDDDKIAEISINLSVQAEGNGQVSEQGMAYNFSKPNVTGTGKTFFNIDKGYLVKAETSTRVEMNLNVTGNDPQKGQMTASRSDLTQNKNYLELLEVN